MTGHSKAGRAVSKDTSDPVLVVDFLLKAGELKCTPRSGWVMRNVLTKSTDRDGGSSAANASSTHQPVETFKSVERVNRVESVADHSWRVSLCSMLIKDPSVDKGVLAQMGTVHDVAECLVGDITPYCGISKEEKIRLENEAITELTNVSEDANLSNGPETNRSQLTDVFNVWKTYEDRHTTEAKLVKDFDLLECVLQAYEYELRNSELDLQEFFDNAEGKIQHPEVQAWERELRARRAKFKSALE